MLTIGTLPLRALCRLARPLPSPEPRWSSVAAGLSAMRAYPSAAPVATPSNSASTARMSGVESSAATKCISDVPGFVKQVVTPASTSVLISPSALVADRVGYVRQGARGRRHRVQLAAAVVRDDHSVDADLDGAARVLDVEHALHDELPVPVLAHPCHVVPGDARVELVVHPVLERL